MHTILFCTGLVYLKIVVIKLKCKQVFLGIISDAVKSANEIRHGFSDDISLNLNKVTNPVVGSTLDVYAAGT